MHRQARADKCEGPACDRTEQQATRARSGEAPGKTPALAGPAGHRWHETQLGEPPKASNQHTLGFWAGMQQNTVPRSRQQQGPESLWHQVFWVG